jgi:hypothetical protein
MDQPNETKLKPNRQAMVPGGPSAVGLVPGGGEIHLIQVDVPVREEVRLITLFNEASVI